jgi:hypothetical protein
MASQRGRDNVRSIDEARTLEQFRRRMAGIEAHVPDPPALGTEESSGAMRLRRRDSGRRETPLNVYVLLAVALAVLVVVALPYLNNIRQAPAVAPAATPSGALDSQARPSPTPAPATPAPATPAPGAVATPRSQAAAYCPRGPTLFEAPWLTLESWAGPDWAVIEGWLRAMDESRLAIDGTRGPFAGPLRPITWPAGYVAALDGDRLSVLDTSGRVVAREGDLVVLGGHLDGDGAGWAACGIRVVKVARFR